MEVNMQVEPEGRDWEKEAKERQEIKEAQWNTENKKSKVEIQRLFSSHTFS